MASIAERAAAGAAFLDEHWPGWWREINLAELSLASPCRCVLGQLWDDGSGWSYQTGRESLGIDQPEARRLGFDAEYVPGHALAPQYAHLTRAWKRIIKQRTEAPEAHDRAGEAWAEGHYQPGVSDPVTEGGA